ncbi:MAG: periplasmic heavy metal sensor [Betaproteobacteria bacterium]|nr:MAG: periplasmic heavy metal sensor [Betaproteobacteria bacterium]
MKQGFFVVLLAIALGGIGTYAVGQPLLDGNPLAMLGNVKSDLKLNTSQQLQWDAVVAQTKAAHDAGRANFEQLKTALQAELAKAEPDFAAVATIADGVRGQHAALHKQTRDAWLALYATFTPEQKAVARDAIKAGIERMQARRAMHHGAPSH